MAKKEEKKISIFGEAKVKSSGSKPKDDKEVVYIDGLESKLLELQFLKAQIADLEAQLVGVTDEIKTISKEKFVELYQSNRSNPNTFLIKDGEGCVMVIPTDRYISIKDEDRANQLIEEYGDDIITIDEKYYFNPQVLERNMSAIEKLIMDAKTISDDDKRNLLVKEVKYSISKGYIDKLAVYGNKIETVIDDIQPIITLKNCGGKMEEGGELDSDFIATIYENGGGVQTFINSSDDISWLKENHLQDLEYENFNSAIIYGNEDSPEKIELFEKLEPLHTDTPTTFILKDDYSGYEKVFEKGGFLGGIFGGGRTYKKGLAYKLDRAKHNKSEDWEVPMKNRKKRYANGGGVDDDERIYTVWVDDAEIGLDYLTHNEAKKLAREYEDEGYDDVVIRAASFAKGGGVDNDDDGELYYTKDYFEYVDWSGEGDNDGYMYGINLLDDNGDVIDAEWFKSESERRNYILENNLFEYRFEKGGFLGGIFGGKRTYKKGLAYKLDRAKHNKSEDWEVPMKNRKKRYENGGGVDYTDYKSLLEEERRLYAEYNKAKADYNREYRKDEFDSLLAQDYKEKMEMLEGKMMEVSNDLLYMQTHGIEKSFGSDDEYANGGRVGFKIGDNVSTTKFDNGKVVNVYTFNKDEIINGKNLKKGETLYEVKNLELGNSDSYVFFENDLEKKFGGNEISKEKLESMVGRKLNRWNDDKVVYMGTTYEKCYLRPYYIKK
jgi:hypothetical protein